MFLILMIVLALKDPILEGRWVIERFISFENIIASKNFQNMDNEQQIRALKMYDLYMERVDLNFKNDTIHFKDLKNEQIIDKIGLWYIDQDTLVINDLEKIATYKYFIENYSDCDLHLKPILPGPIVGKSGSTFKRENCK